MLHTHLSESDYKMEMRLVHIFDFVFLFVVVACQLFTNEAFFSVCVLVCFFVGAQKVEQTLH